VEFFLPNINISNPFGRCQENLIISAAIHGEKVAGFLSRLCSFGMIMRTLFLSFRTLRFTQGRLSEESFLSVQDKPYTEQGESVREKS